MCGPLAPGELHVDLLVLRVQAKDEASGRDFYYNSETGASQWEVIRLLHVLRVYSHALVCFVAGKLEELHEKTERKLSDSLLYELQF